MHNFLRYAAIARIAFQWNVCVSGLSGIDMISRGWLSPHFGIKMHHFDITTAYLNGDEQILMKTPKQLAGILRISEDQNDKDLVSKAETMLQELQSGDKVSFEEIPIRSLSTRKKLIYEVRWFTEEFRANSFQRWSLSVLVGKRKGHHDNSSLCRRHYYRN